MRAYYFLLIAATTLLAGSNAVSAATDSDNMNLSHMTTPDTIQSVESAQAATTKRFLRSNKYAEEDEDSDDDLEGSDDDDLDDEERASLPTINMLDEVVKTASKSTLSDDAIKSLIKSEAHVQDMKLFQQLSNGGVSMEKLTTIMNSMSKDINPDKLKQFYGWFKQIQGGKVRAVANAAV